ncbi:flagellar biosynthetic protein FliR [Christensenellaceae bacterium OttesenSCG-928-M15]|nr:flagellar biosynthetic protein FliR [Christensenellaceae bacterium OttesenSCG-928-M15]
MEAYAFINGTSLEYVFLLFLRMAGLIWTSPIFGRKNVPNMAKLAYCLSLTYFFFVSVPQYAPLPTGSLFTFVMYGALELLFGIIMGYILTLFFDVAFTAGQLVDWQMGFSMASVFDVESNASVPVTGNLINIMTLLMFFALDGHLMLIRLMHTALIEIPIGGVVYHSGLTSVIVEFFIQAFVLAIRLALPMIASGMIAEVVLGLILRAVPQMNVFVIGMPLKVLLGLAMLAAIMPVYVDFTTEIFDTMFNGISRAFMELRA